MKLRNSALVLTVSVWLWFAPSSHAEVIETGDLCLPEQIFRSASATYALVLVSVAPVVLGDETVGHVLAYDDPSTKRSGNYFELHDSWANLVAVSWYASLMNGVAFAAEDHLNETLQEQGRVRQDDKSKELEGQQDLENLRRDTEINRLQQELDTIKRQHPDFSPAQRPEAVETQRQLDQLRNDQQMQRLKNEQKLDRIQRERDPLRQRQQIDDLQRRQRIESLQDEIRRNQTEQDLNRLRRPHIIGPGPYH